MSDATYTLSIEGDERATRLAAFLENHAEWLTPADVAAVSALNPGETYRGRGWRITRDSDCDDCGGEGCRHCDYSDYAARPYVRRPVV